MSSAARRHFVLLRRQFKHAACFAVGTLSLIPLLFDDAGDGAVHSSITSRDELS